LFFAVADNSFTECLLGGAFIFFVELLDDIFDLLEGLFLDSEEAFLFLIHQHIVLPALRSNLAKIPEESFLICLQE